MENRRRFLQQLGLGVPALSASGGGLLASGDRVGGQESREGMIPVAGDPSSRRSRASAVQEAIDRAEEAGGEGETLDVFLPGNFGPDRDGYDASAVDFSGAGGTWSGRVLREGQICDVYDVKAYGAAGDGATDDLAAFESARDAADRRGEVVLFVPSAGGRRYVWSDTFRITDRLHLVGTSMDQRSEIRYTGTGDMLRVGDGRTPVVGTRVANLDLDAGGADACVRGYYWTNGTRLESLTLDNATNALALQRSWYAMVQNIRSRGNITGDAFSLHGPSNTEQVNSVVFTNVVANGCDGDGFRLDGSHRGVTFLGCFSENTGGAGFHVDGAGGGVSLVGCYTENNADIAVNVGTSARVTGFSMLGGKYDLPAGPDAVTVRLDRVKGATIQGSRFAVEDPGDRGGNHVLTTAETQGPLDLRPAIVSYAEGGDFAGPENPRANPYSVSNVTSDRRLDADDATVEDLADVLGTLIRDLQRSGALS